MKIAMPLMATLMLLLPLLASSIGGSQAQGQEPSVKVPPGPKMTATITEVPNGGLLSRIGSVVFMPDGKTLAAGDVNGVIRLYDSATMRERTSFKPFREPFGGSQIKLLAYAPDGRTLAGAPGFNSELGLVDADTGRFRLELIRPSSVASSLPLCLAFSPDGKTVAAGFNNGEVVIWDAATGQRRAVTPPFIVPPHTEPFDRAERPLPAPVLDLAFAPDGETLLSFAIAGPPRAWNAATGAERTTPFGLDRPTRPALTADGKVIALAEPLGDPNDPARRYTFWDATTWQKKSEWKTPLRFRHQALLPGGRVLVLQGGTDFQRPDGPDIQLQDAEDGRILATLRFPYRAYFASLAVSPNGKLIALGGGGDGPDFGIIQLIETDGKTLRPWVPKP